MKNFYKITLLLALIINSGITLKAENTSKNNKREHFKNVLVAPSASISGTTSVCQNSAQPQITFTGSAGTAPYTFTYKIGNGSPLTVVSTGNTATVNASTAAIGVFTYTLVSVHDAATPNTEQSSTGSAIITVSTSPTIDFTFTNDNSCSGTVMQFSSSSTGTAPYTYAWDFGDGNSSTQQNPSHSFVSLGCGTGIFNVKLTITSGNCSVTKTKTITVKQKPNIDFTDVINPFDPFSNCANASSNPIYSITVGNASSSACISSYSINWGDGNSQANVSFPLSHTYSSIGAYDMVITALGTNGCSNSKTYVIKNVSNPLGGLNSPGSTQNLCAPTANLQFSISNWGSNSLDTTYNINYSDGSPIVVLTQNQLNSSIYYNASNPSGSANYPIPHIYTTSSCPLPSFEVKLDVTNACGTTPFSLGNISILTKPAANFTSPANGCVNNSILFTNTTISGYGQNCVQGSIYTWNFGDGSPIITTPVSTPQNISHTYTNPGTYTVILTSQNGCGISTKTQQICIESPVTPQFTINTILGCIPMAVTATNTTVVANSCTPPTYIWSAAYVPAYCGTSITPIPNQTTTNATFNFIESGTYNITLSTTNSCGTTVSPAQTVTVKKPPTISSINGILANYCGPVSINPTAIVNSCAPASSTLTYAWSFPGGTPALSSLAVPGAISYTATGNHTVSLIVTNECGSSTTTTKSFTINDTPVLTNSPLNQTICSGSATTIVNLTANPSGANFSWTATATAGISGFATSGTNTIPVQTISTTNSSSGTVTYAITPSLAGCPGVVTNYIITVNPSPTITQPIGSTICSGGTVTPLSVSVTPAPTAGSATYKWYSNTTGDTNIATSTLVNTSTIDGNYNPPSTLGTIYYFSEISFSSGSCSNIKTNIAQVTIQPNTTITSQPTMTQNLCVGVTISSPLSISAGGTGTINYQWYSNTTNSNSGGSLITGATSANYTPAIFTVPNSYYYYATASLNGNGCLPVTSNVAEIIVFADPTISSQPITSQTLCQNASPSNLEVTATGGNGAFGYQWYRNSANSNTGGTLIAGAINDSYTPPTNAVATTYYYCVVSQNSTSGCSVTSSVAEVIVISAPTITQPASSTICLGATPTLLSITVSGATGTPQYQWYSNSANNTTNGTIISGATNPTYNPQKSITGTTYYYCIITLPTGGCSNLTSTTAEVIINQNPVVSNKTDLICSGKSFTINPVTLGGDTVPAGTTYTWPSPTFSPIGSIIGAAAQLTAQTNISQTLTNTTISPVIVTYTVTPLSGTCPGANFTIEVTVNPSISPNVTPNNSTCFGTNNGAIQTNITGGIPFSSGAPYVVSWTGPNGFTSSASNISNLAPGNYNLSITDAGGCPINEDYSITEPTDINIITDLEKDVTCFNAADGEIKISITGGTLNHKISWTKNGSPYAITEDLSNLSPGNYIVTVSDANNCGPKTASFTITEPPIMVVSLGSKTDILCFGQATGSINTNIVGGTLPYTFAWIGPNGFTSSVENLTALFAGTYDLLVTDDLGCSKNLSVVITQTPEIIITATTTPITCYGDDNASINITISGGLAPYQISWSNLASGTFQNNLSAGDYLITIIDALNCTKTLNVNIPEAPIFTVNPVVKNISCFGANNGSIKLNFIGGIVPVNLTWSDGSVSGTTRNNLSPGSYTVTIVDSKPCTITRTFNILEPQLLVLSANLTNDLDCNNTSTGAINLLVSGGTAPFTYIWSNGATTEDLNNIPAGSYLVTVTDANGCSQQAQYNINRPLPITAGVITQTEFNCDTKYVKKTFTADVSGGIPPYQLAWSSGVVSGTNNEIMNPTQNGTVILDVTDSIGCKSNYTFEVDVPTLGTPSFDTNSYAYSAYGLYSINDPIQFNNTATGDYTNIAWDFGDGTFSTETNPVHKFVNPKDYVVTQTVTYPFGCVYVHKITLTLEKGYLLVVPNAFTPNNDSINDTFRPVTKGLKNVRLDVYDTWGSLIYSESGDVLRGWDGKIKGFKVENGNYYCKVSGETFYGTVINENHPFVLIK